MQSLILYCFFHISQVRGRTPLNTKISELTRNKVDFCIQCLSCPDTLPNKTIGSEASNTMNEVPLLSPSDVGHDDYFMYNKNFKRPRTILKRKFPDDTLSIDAQKWNSGRKKIPSKQSCLVVVVSPKTNEHCESYHQAKHRYVNPVHHGKYFIPFLSTAMDKSDPYITFHMISVQDYQKLKTLASKGIEVGPGGSIFDDFILKNCPSHSIQLLCVDDLVRVTAAPDYHGSIRVFAGGSASNIVDETFEETELENIKSSARFKICQSNEYCDHIPLSMGFFDSTFHKLKIGEKHVKLFRSEKYCSRF